MIFNKQRTLAMILFCFTGLGTILGQTEQDSIKKISILFIGDIMGHDGQITSAENRQTHTYNYDTVFSYISPVIREADVAIANLEVTLAGRPYTGYPQFSSPVELASSCKKAGIDYLVTANNHSADRGRKGIRNTIFRLDSIGIPHTGTYLSKENRDSVCPLIINKNGFRLALLNYTYATNGIIVPPPFIVDSLDQNNVLMDIERSRKMAVDAIILFLHWGTEYDTVPSKSQSEMAKLFMQAGADLVIGSHPHVIQKMTRTTDTTSGKEGLIVYSMGNFVSNQRRPWTDGGAMVKITLEKKDNKTSIAEAGYFLTWVYTPIIDFRLKFYILPCSQFENNPAFFTQAGQFSQMKTYINKSRFLFQQQNKGITEYTFNGTSWALNGKR